MKTDIEIVSRCTRATRGGELVVALVSGMVARHRWRHVEDPADRPRHLCLVGADTIAEASELLAQVPAWQRLNTLLVGVEGEVFELGRLEPRRGSIGELLETFELAGYLPSHCLSDWRPVLSGFAGRKDLMRRIGTNCFKAGQSANYCDWVHSPGRDVFEFLAALAGVLGSDGRSL